MNRDFALNQAIAKVGVTGLAKLISELSPDNPISPQGVSKWRRCPSARVLQVEKATGIPRSALRPDIYPDQMA